MRKVIRVGSRESKLAVAQTMLVLKEIEKNHPEIVFELVTMKTTGDKILDRNLDQIGGKGLFVKELDQALLDGRVDITIHSLKDLPMEISEEIPLLGFSKRKGAEESFQTGCIGTSSRRRMEQLKKLYPKASYRGIRGNVQTRMQKLEKEGYDATILAVAGLKRLSMEKHITKIFSTDEMLPAAGQGILAFQGRKDEDYSYLTCACSAESEYAAIAERSFVSALDGGCSSPIAAFAKVNEDKVTLKGLYYHEPAKDFSVGTITGTVSEAKGLGEKLARELQKKWVR